MDTAVALVRTYLQTNGFFTVTEYPILEAVTEHDTRTVTDIDVLGLRFPGVGTSSDDRTTGGLMVAPHGLLDLREDQIEVIIGEVKEGAAVLNRSARNPDVLSAVLRRFGAVDNEVIAQLVDQLIETSEAIHPAGIRIRLMVFASKPPKHRNETFTWISIGTIARWMREQVRDNWERLKSVQSKDPALSFLMLFEKAERGES